MDFVNLAVVFWEVYSGSAGLSREMENGFQVRTFDVPEWDFTKASDRRRFRQLLESERPHAVWLAPPCPKWSPLQNLRLGTKRNWNYSR